MGPSNTTVGTSENFYLSLGNATHLWLCAIRSACDGFRARGNSVKLLAGHMRITFLCLGPHTSQDHWAKSVFLERVPEPACLAIPSLEIFARFGRTAPVSSTPTRLAVTGAACKCRGAPLPISLAGAGRGPSEQMDEEASLLLGRIGHVLKCVESHDCYTYGYISE